MLVGHARPHLGVIVTGSATAEQVRAALDAVNSKLPHFKRVRDFHVASEPFSIENGLLTANSKMRRGAIAAHYEQAVGEMYA